MPIRLSTSRRLSPSLTSGSASSTARFSTTTRVARQATHYETLHVPVTATAAEIKKQFYALSLKHHPDRNHSDPNATERFANISSAYQILGDSSKRARYDRDHGIVSASGQHHPTGSYSSAGAASMRNSGNNSSYVGSRPASGLSKRRGTFKGPPPSFYAHGGYGARASRPGAGGTYTSPNNTGNSSNSSSRSGPAPTEEDPSSFIHNNPVWHFNAKGHFKTQAAEDARREQRRSNQKRREQEEIRDSGVDSSGSLILRFMIVSGILVSVATLGGLLRNNNSGPKSGKQTNFRNKDR